MGDEMPRPRTADFHATFSVSLQRSGNPVSVDTPVVDGPRQCGQFSARMPVAERTISTASTYGFIARFSWEIHHFLTHVSNWNVGAGTAQPLFLSGGVRKCK